MFIASIVVHCRQRRNALVHKVALQMSVPMAMNPTYVGQGSPMPVSPNAGYTGQVSPVMFAPSAAYVGEVHPTVVQGFVPQTQAYPQGYPQAYPQAVPYYQQPNTAAQPGTKPSLHYSLILILEYYYNFNSSYIYIVSI